MNEQLKIVQNFNLYENLWRNENEENRFKTNKRMEKRTIRRIRKIKNRETSTKKCFKLIID